MRTMQGFSGSVDRLKSNFEMRQRFLNLSNKPSVARNEMLDTNLTFSGLYKHRDQSSRQTLRPLKAKVVANADLIDSVSAAGLSYDNRNSLVGVVKGGMARQAEDRSSFEMIRGSFGGAAPAEVKQRSIAEVIDSITNY